MIGKCTWYVNIVSLIGSMGGGALSGAAARTGNYI